MADIKTATIRINKELLEHNLALKEILKETLDWMLANSDHTTSCSEKFHYKCVCTCGLSDLLEELQ